MDPDKMFEFGQKNVEDIRQERSRYAGRLTSGMQVSTKDHITVDELRYTRNVITGEKDDDLTAKVTDAQVQALLDHLHNNSLKYYGQSHLY